MALPMEESLRQKILGGTLTEAEAAAYMNAAAEQVPVGSKHAGQPGIPEPPDAGAGPQGPDETEKLGIRRKGGAEL